jgi:hypothetical protein
MRWILFLIISSTSYATEPFEKWTCQKQIKGLVSEWGAGPAWIKHFVGGMSEHFFASPTKKVGEWILIRKTDKGEAVAKMTQEGRVEVAFEGKYCHRRKAVPHLSVRPRGFFDDQNLREFIDASPKGIIYVWSPRMPLSVKGIIEIKKVAANKKLPLLILLHKDVAASEVKKLAMEIGRENVRQVDSFEFKMRNIDQHYPAILVFKDGKIMPEVKYGHEKAKRYQLDIERMLKL